MLYILSSELSHPKNLSWWTVLGQQKGLKTGSLFSPVWKQVNGGSNGCPKRKISGRRSVHENIMRKKAVGIPKCNNVHFKEYWPGNNLFLLGRAPTGVDDKKIRSGNSERKEKSSCHLNPSNLTGSKIKML